ncbi:MAG TPA: DUF4388 domain-containing protein [Thermoanaerobaculia bacterium]|nr:DUF4388 domain-containing protein [Thermoanaerobaculia bacterium]
MSFQGSLKELPLPDIIQLVSVSGKTGKFTLTRGDEEGLIFLRNGQIIHAESGEMTGEEAVYALAIWKEGDFVFAQTEETTEQTITRSNTNLLMEAARRADEWKVLSRKIPSVDMIPILLPRDNRHEQITLNPQEWLLVTRIDGQQSVAGIAQSLELSSFEAAKILYGMLTAELVGLTRSKADEAPAEADDTEVEALVDLARQIRGVAEQHIGANGSKSIEKHFGSAVEAIRSGSGPLAIRAMIRELEKTTALLRGSAVAEQLRNDIATLLRSTA